MKATTFQKKQDAPAKKSRRRLGTELVTDSDSGDDGNESPPIRKVCVRPFQDCICSNQECYADYKEASCHHRKGCCSPWGCSSVCDTYQIDKNEGMEVVVS